jgi:RNA polymerase sigma-70 factor, ECF subfamily
MFLRTRSSDDGKNRYPRGASRNESEKNLSSEASSEPGSPDDAVLAANLASGDQDALTVLFDRYRDLVFSIARRILRDDGEAEETVQQVFLDIFRSITQFDPAKGNFRAWLLQFAYHRSINRKEHLQARRFYDWRQLDDIAPEELVEGAGRPFQMSRQELVRLAQELLASLDQRHRRIVEMTLFGGYTAEEIAKSSGETASAVRHILYRSLGRLYAVLAESERGRRTPEAAKEGAYIVSPRTL